MASETTVYISYVGTNLKYCDETDASLGDGFTGPSVVTFDSDIEDLELDIVLGEVYGTLAVNISSSTHKMCDDSDNSFVVDVICCDPDNPPPPPPPPPGPDDIYSCCDYMPKDFISWSNGLNLKRLIPPNER